MDTSGKRNYLITGYPGIGKTTMIEKITKAFTKHDPAGFFTREILEGGMRAGFELRSLDGKRIVLSHVDIDSPYKVGKYKVDVIAFEQYIESIRLSGNMGKLVIIDEIGKMECMSGKFITFTKRLLEAENIVLLATVALRGGGFISEIKKRSDVKIYEITLKNRETFINTIIKDIERKLMEAKELK